ncbi:hypothetical protein KCP76_02005 [Salmonella enterica subsp. enterica serovar Weltevreden]|nr:hypothetical protein KCP76_02005 [Salmonella enterica subsp. enterica serovar Weltevreden]
MAGRWSEARNVLEQLFSDGRCANAVVAIASKINLSGGGASRASGINHERRPVQRICTIFIMKRYPKTLNLRLGRGGQYFISDGRRMSMNML